MNVNDIIKMDISRNTSSVSRAGFGTILFLGLNAKFSERVRLYSSLSAVSNDFSEETDEYLAAQKVFSQSPTPTTFKVARKGADEALNVAMNEVVQFDNDWYFLTAHTHKTDDIIALAEWAEANKKLYFTSYSGSEAYDPQVNSDPGSKVYLASYDRTTLVYSATAEKFPECAWLGKQCTTVEGTTTWAFKTLSGVTPDNLSDNQIQVLMGTSTKRGKGYNVYTYTAGQNITFDGRVASGEFIDVIRGADALESRIRERVYSLFVNQGKVPYNAVGAAQIESCIRGVLSDFNTRGFIEADYTVTVPNLREADVNLRANRIAEGFSFTANLSGAIHYVSIHGTLSV